MASNIVQKAKSAIGLDKSSNPTLVGKKLHNAAGFGLMGLTWRANPPPQEQAFAAMKEALQHGSNFWNGGEIYGPPTRNSLHLLNEYFTRYPEDSDKVVLSIKGGGPPENAMKPDGSAENTRRSIQACLDLLDGKKKLDIWEAARVDPDTPIEVTMRAAQEFVDAGKLGGISLSEVGPDTIRRAAKVVKVAAVEVEVSLFALEIFENGVAQACAELDIPVVAYSPLGRGFLTGQLRSRDQLEESDFRRHLPRFSEENFDKNLQLVAEVEKIATRKGVTLGQVALAWVKAKSGRDGNPILIPIPGSTTPERVRENLVDVHLSEAELKELDDWVARIEVTGGRYNEQVGQYNFGVTPPLKE